MTTCHAYRFRAHAPIVPLIRRRSTETSSQKARHSAQARTLEAPSERAALVYAERHMRTRLASELGRAVRLREFGSLAVLMTLILTLIPNGPPPNASLIAC